jgi:hypothetical protein
MIADDTGFHPAVAADPFGFDEGLISAQDEDEEDLDEDDDSDDEDDEESDLPPGWSD